MYLAKYRHMLVAQAYCDSVQMDLLNTHLEHAEERVNQLKQCLGLVSKWPPGSTVST